MKHTILILAILAMAGGGYANEDESSPTSVSGGPAYIGDIPAGTGVDIELVDEEGNITSINDILSGCVFVHMRTWTDEEQSKVLAILERCLEYVPSDPPCIHYVGEQEDARRQLRSDIEAALKALQ